MRLPPAYETFLSKLPDKWTLQRFGDLLESLRNGIYKKKEFHGRGQKIVNMGELFAYDFISSQEMKRVELSDRELERYLVQDGDLLFARRSLVLEGSGKCSLVTQPIEDTTFESSIIRARPNRNILDPRFYFYFFASPIGRAIMASIATRTAVSGIRGSDLLEVQVLYPPLDTQHRIAAVLSAYDDLIENNTQRITALEAAAHALYREWFIEFRFPGHEAVEWMDSELGEIPTGWAWIAFPDAIDINPRHRIPKDTEKHYVPMEALDIGSMLINGFEVRTGNSGSKFKNHDTLMARITPSLENGKTGYVQILPTDDTVAIGSTEFIVLRSKTLSPEFVYLLARSPEVREPAIASMTGASGRQRVQTACFDEIYIPQPNKNVLEDFQRRVRPNFELIHSLSERNIILREARDLLLPRLISGELSVDNINIKDIEP